MKRSSCNKLRTNIWLAIVGTFLVASVAGQETKAPTRLIVSPDHLQVLVGKEVSVKVEVRSARDLFGAPFYLSFDPYLLEAIKVSDGGFLKGKEKQSVFMQTIDARRGRIIVGVTRLGNESGVSGDGVLANVTFRALRIGAAKLLFEKTDLRDSRQASVPAHPNSAIIEIR